MYSQVICSAIERIINKALALNLQGASGLDVLDAKALTLTLEELPFSLHFIINDRYVSVLNGEEALSGSDCSINTSLATLKMLQKSQQLTELIKQDKLAIEGDVKVAQQFAQLAENLKIDWRSEIAKHIGDIPTYKLEQFTQFIADKLGFISKQAQADSSEWLVHEKRLVVTQSQIALFNQAVSDICSDTAALHARVERLLNISNNTNQG